MHAHILVTTTDVHQLQHAMVKSVMPCVLQDPSNPCMHNTPNLLHRKDGLEHFPHAVTVVDVSHGVLPQTVTQAQGNDPAYTQATTTKGHTVKFVVLLCDPRRWLHLNGVPQPTVRHTVRCCKKRSHMPADSASGSSHNARRVRGRCCLVQLSARCIKSTPAAPCQVHRRTSDLLLPPRHCCFVS